MIIIFILCFVFAKKNKNKIEKENRQPQRTQPRWNGFHQKKTQPIPNHKDTQEKHTE